MVNKTIKSFLRILLILLALNSLGFQLFNFVLGTMVRSSLDKKSDSIYYVSEFIPHLFTIIICVWFIVHQIKLIGYPESVSKK